MTTATALAGLLVAETVAAPIPISVRGRGWIEADVLRCEDGRLWLALPGRSGEFAVAVSEVAWAAFPAPADIGALERSALAGHEDAARRLREAFEATRTMVAVPGSHAPRLGLAVVAHLDQGDPAEMGTILETLARDAWDHQVRSLAALRLARLRLAQDRASDAADICRSLLASGTTARNEAEAWLALGRACEDLGDPEAARDAYLHPVALYARDLTILRNALEGAERASRALGDPQGAETYAGEMRNLTEPTDPATAPQASHETLTATEGEDAP